LHAAEKLIEFFKIIRAYRIAIIRENQSTSSFRAIAHAVILQKIIQDQTQGKNESFNQNEQSNKNKSRDNFINRKRDDKCVCDEEHSFKKCSYIVNSIGKRDERRTKMSEIRCVNKLRKG
jgi:hypothetical protein